ncbi:MAG: phosphoribosyltransferase [Candidatus Methanosuratus sp.]|nr:phosphoribosyltransferase [Candidatus Methanosuratincola sp.]
MEMLVMTWDKVHTSVLDLSRKIDESGFHPDTIVGVARGGWVVARLLSDLIGVDDLLSLRITFYRGMNQREAKPKIDHPIVGGIKGKRVLIADDVADTGESLLLAVRHLSRLGASDIRVATLHVKPWSKITPDYYFGSSANWIVYPWEYRETMSSLIREWRKESLTPYEAKERLVSSGIPADIVERFFPKIAKEMH